MFLVVLVCQQENNGEMKTDAGRFHPKILYVIGKENDVADALSRLDMNNYNNDKVE